jgi:CBS domain-containing protein
MPQDKRVVARDVMTTRVVTGGTHDDLTRIAGEMQRHQIGSVVIVENRKPVGILTERDFVRIVERVGALMENSLAKNHMTATVLSVKTETPIADVVKLMGEKHVRHLIVLDSKGDLAGIISSRDVMKATKNAL